MVTNRRTFITALALTAAQLSAAPAVASPLLGALRNAAARRSAAAAVEPAAQKAAVKAASAAKPHDVLISSGRHPQAAAHIHRAQAQGQPSVLHIDRAGASARRRASTGSVDRLRKPTPLSERDEYPPAFTAEGGRNANVRYIDRHDNRGAGSTMGAQTRSLPDGSRIRIIITK